MKRIFSLVLVLSLVLFASAHGETPIEQVEFEEQTLLLAVVPVKKNTTTKYPFFIIVYIDGELIPVNVIPSQKIREGYISSEEYIQEIAEIRNNPIIPIAEPLTPPKDELIILFSIEPVEERFQVYAFLRDRSIVKFSSFPKEWGKSSIKIEDFCDFLNSEITSKEKYEPNPGKESVIIDNGRGDGFIFPISKEFITNSLILTSFDKLYELKIAKK